VDDVAPVGQPLIDIEIDAEVDDTTSKIDTFSEQSIETKKGNC
jgi:hypothetical protein